MQSRELTQDFDTVDAAVVALGRLAAAKRWRGYVDL
jgi:predicted DNA-binding WGR domain protein